MFGAVGPIVAPANDQIATVYRMAVAVEIFALKFKFDQHTLPSAWNDLALGLAVGKFLLNCLDHKAEIFCQHSEKTMTPCSFTGSCRKPCKWMGSP